MMFKKNLMRRADFRRKCNGCLRFHQTHPRLPKAGLRLCALLFLSFGLGGCQTVPPLPAVNLEDPAWTVHQGQAVWRRDPASPELAGDVLLAMRNDGRAFVQFTKTPFPFVVAQKTTNTWEIEFPTQKRRYSGRGRPPGQLVWLQLPAALAEERLGRGWSWQRLSNDRWELQNQATGERLEGVFDR